MHKVIALIAGLAVVLVASSVTAEPAGRPCGPRSEVVAGLAKKYQESPVAIGVTSGGGLVEVLSSSGGETWTIIVSSPEGISCLVTSGEGWRKMEYFHPGPEA